VIDMSRQLIALNRFGLGARPGEAQRLDDPRGWLLDQTRGGPPELLDATPGSESPATLIREFVSASRAQDQNRLRPLRRRIQQHLVAEVGNVLATRARTERPFAERWVAFWSNHLCISAAGGAREALLAGSYEREAIRPHVFGRFEEMVLASARHPAMLYYLDNAASAGPDSPQLTRLRRRRRDADRAQERGLNENYARELLELHTVGVEGGYTQEDVVELARILTGWTVRGAGLGGARNDGDLGFRFIAGLHEPGRKTVMGTRYGEGEEAGVRVIRDLSRRPETARFVAGKIATHFIDDVPPQPAIDALAARWMETEGDLGEVARTLVRIDAAWGSEYRKFRTPQDWLVALLRAVDAREAAPNLGEILRQLRHPLWSPPSPKGFGDLRREWADPDALMNRAELARTIAERAGRGGRRPRDLRPLTTVMALEPGDPLPPMLADTSIPADERIALAFAGPAFQWR
jgi:uncharacterized protein (DUF1800 family)